MAKILLSSGVALAWYSQLQAFCKKNPLPYTQLFTDDVSQSLGHPSAFSFSLVNAKVAASVSIVFMPNTEEAQASPQSNAVM